MINNKLIQDCIATANNWLKINRPTAKPISLDEVVSRLNNSSSFLGTSSDAKTSKGTKQGYLTGILYLAPADICKINLCPAAKTCLEDCLFNAGRGRFANVSRARIIKTLAFLYNKPKFEEHLAKDINKLIKQAETKNMIPTVRLNGTSDIFIDKVFKRLLNDFSQVQFYDYTKVAVKFAKSLPKNYDLTFSFDGTNWKDSLNVLKNKGRVAVVFKNGLPTEFDGYKVINGDDTDLRFLDDTGIIIGLNAKGSAKKDEANELFIIDSNTDTRCKFS